MFTTSLRQLAKHLRPAVTRTVQLPCRAFRVHVNIRDGGERGLTVAQWNCNVGDFVEQDEPLGTLSAGVFQDGVVITAPESGQIVSRLQEGSELHDGHALFTLDTDDVDDDYANEDTIEMEEPTKSNEDEEEPTKS